MNFVFEWNFRCFLSIMSKVVLFEHILLCNSFLIRSRWLKVNELFFSSLVIEYYDISFWNFFWRCLIFIRLADIFSVFFFCICILHVLKKFKKSHSSRFYDINCFSPNIISSLSLKCDIILLALTTMKPFSMCKIHWKFENLKKKYFWKKFKKIKNEYETIRSQLFKTYEISNLRLHIKFNYFRVFKIFLNIVRKKTTTKRK